MLARIATEDEDRGWAIREAAIRRLADPVLLAKIAREDKYSAEIRIAAIKNKNFTDPVLLANIAIKDKDPSPCYAAIYRITDQAALVKIAMHAMNHKVREAALRHLMKWPIIDYDCRSPEYVRENDIEKLTDQIVLAKIAVGDQFPSVRKAATKKLTDQKLLMKLAVEDREPEVRRAAINKVTDQVFLARIAAEDKDPAPRYAAVAKLTDLVLLEKIPMEYRDFAVRYRACLGTDYGNKPIVNESSIIDSL